MPSKVYIRADEDAIWCDDPADVVVKRVEQAGAEDFVQVTLISYGPADPHRTAYVRAGDVTAVLPIGRLEMEAVLEDPPDWYHD
ncbi:hypothetical protein [Paraconexibacter algicola]|uniref:Uncharacterized protein n=1 Tax=Paraconexibacter algicola TaxID=2133960 RepID=A0A2T4UHL1_9ACTN|nr:hypothetical protein [Paraconexibacter algicola]PTL58732.1 hypothetical protein C7Y72_03250 [Paraconexibacter algicola]